MNGGSTQNQAEDAGAPFRPAAGPPFGCAVAVMAKASVPGRAKTRLVPPLSPEEAARFNTSFLQDVALNLLRAGAETPIAPFMAFGPPGSEPFFAEHMPATVGLVETWFPNFGDCLFHAASTLIGLGHGSACVLNADSPTLPTAILVEMAEVLGRDGDRAVLGPSTDGGYYLLGLKAPHRRLFADIDWSTERVAGQTLERARELGLPVHVLPTWYDVDDSEALRILHGELFAGRRFGDSGLPPHEAPNTRRLMRSLLDDGLGARLGLPAESAPAKVVP